MAMEYRIHDAAERHIDALEELERQCFSVPWTRQQLRCELPDDRHIFLVAEAGDRLLGYVGLMHVLDEGYLSNVAVAPDCRRQGVAAALIAELLRRAGERELSFVTLEVRTSNSPAIALYERFGFRRVGLRKNYYEYPREDALLMTYVLNRGESFEDTCV